MYAQIYEMNFPTSCAGVESNYIPCDLAFFFFFNFPHKIFSSRVVVNINLRFSAAGYFQFMLLYFSAA